MVRRGPFTKHREQKGGISALVVGLFHPLKYNLPRIEKRKVFGVLAEGTFLRARKKTAFFFRWFFVFFFFFGFFLFPKKKERKISLFLSSFSLLSPPLLISTARARGIRKGALKERRHRTFASVPGALWLATTLSLFRDEKREIKRSCIKWVSARRLATLLRAGRRR